jgi:hypothetical protein
MIVASYVLHYGAQYLAWSIRSIQDAVDEIQVFYSPKPSFGRGEAGPCPESEEDLKREACRFLSPGKTLRWVRGLWPMEGAHRDAAVDAAASRGASVVFIVDADEIWDPGEAKVQVAAALAAPERETLAPFCHFWRCFNYVCVDPSRPLRFLKLAGKGLRYADQKIPVLHFGYAQTEEITKYKIAIHGHLSEWRPRWLADKFLAWRPGVEMKDVHPTCGWNSSFNDYFWNPKPTPPELVEVVGRTLADHPYRNLEIVV